jgi:hypothetical protein
MNKSILFKGVFLTILSSTSLLFAQIPNLAASSEIHKERTEVPRTEDNTIASYKTNLINTKQIFNINNVSSINKNGVNYQVTKSGFVSFKIFDYNGNEVASLINRKQYTGNYFANFSTINLSSGIYKYSISLDDKSICSRTLFVN